MNAHLTQNKFFTVQAHESIDKALTLTPSKYVDELPPLQAIAEMEDYIKALEDILAERSHESTGTMRTSRLGSLAFEIDLVRSFLASFKRVYGTMH